MSTGAGLLGPVRLGDTEGVTQGRYAGLQVELRGLCQVRLLAKVVEVKQCGAALHLSLHEGRRGDLHQHKQRNKQTEVKKYDPELTELMFVSSVSYTTDTTSNHQLILLANMGQSQINQHQRTCFLT